MRDAGLTLFELLAALALAAIVSGGAVYGFRDATRRWRLAAGVRQVVLDLRSARVRAVVEGTAQRLRFDPELATYRREARDADGDYIALGRVRLPIGVRIVDCSGSGESIGFRPAGHASPFGTITLRDHHGAIRRVIVGISGRVRVES